MKDPMSDTYRMLGSFLKKTLSFFSEIVVDFCVLEQFKFFVKEKES